MEERKEHIATVVAAVVAAAAVAAAAVVVVVVIEMKTRYCMFGQKVGRCTPSDLAVWP